MLQDVSCFYSGLQSRLPYFPVPWVTMRPVPMSGQVWTAVKPLAAEIWRLCGNGMQRPLRLCVSRSYFHIIYSTCLCWSLQSVRSSLLPCDRKRQPLLLLFSWLCYLSQEGIWRKTFGWYRGLKCSPKFKVHPEPQNVILLENKIFAEVIKMRSWWIRVDPKSNDWWWIRVDPKSNDV